MTSKVYFSNLRSEDESGNKGNKLIKLFNKANFSDLYDKDELVGVKIHFGERGNDAYISPTLIRYLVDEIKKTDANPFLTDTNTLYFGLRHNSVDHLKTATLNGFSYSVVGVPLIIADGLKGEHEVLVDINQKHIKTARIGGDIFNADGLLVVSHFKGHTLSGFGGAIKNLAMGCATISGKLEQHKVSKPIIQDNCISCGVCQDACPVDAILNRENSYLIDYDKCVVCMDCMSACKNDAIDLNWEEEIPKFIERMGEYALGAVKNKQDKTAYVNFLTNITPHCDCFPFSDAPIVPDIGFLASDDPVAIDAASLHLVNQQKGIKDSLIHKNCNHGEDKFKGVWEKVDGDHLLEYCQDIGLGTTDFEIIEI
ncbi:MAG: DUF362 domain-containing protein [Methanobrevibacter sp.]|jgi:uncharacterized Fe-S center protein|nr:DUF362 domain-containing protein [Candidatus Methanovirga aequatorialis]